jgi:hypothetical protein
MSLSSWLRSWFATASVSRRLSGSQEHLDRLERMSDESTSRLERRAKQLDALMLRIGIDVEDAKRIHRRLEAALVETREQNAVLEKTVQTLVASHELLIARADAETALAVRARVGAAARE